MNVGLGNLEGRISEVRSEIEYEGYFIFHTTTIEWHLKLNTPASHLLEVLEAQTLPEEQVERLFSLSACTKDHRELTLNRDSTGFLLGLFSLWMYPALKKGNTSLKKREFYSNEVIEILETMLGHPL